jgi:hypothetical protein
VGTERREKGKGRRKGREGNRREGRRREVGRKQEGKRESTRNQSIAIVQIISILLCYRYKISL